MTSPSAAMRMAEGQPKPDAAGLRIAQGRANEVSDTLGWCRPALLTL